MTSSQDEIKTWAVVKAIEADGQDTLIAGDGLCNEAAVRFTATHGRQAIEELIELSVPFTACQADDEQDCDLFPFHLTRRTITRFMAAIMIAVSIEALLLMFKSAIGAGDYLTSATWMMLSAVALMVGLGLYVYLGAKAENLLMTVKRHKLGHYYDADETVNEHQRGKS